MSPGLSAWRIEEAPTAKDPRRHVLLVKAALSEVHALIRRFGAVCGRPKKERGGEFNYSLFLHGLSADELGRVRDELSGLGVGEARGGVAAAHSRGVGSSAGAVVATPAPAPVGSAVCAPTEPGLGGLQIPAGTPEGADAPGAAPQPLEFDLSAAVPAGTPAAPEPAVTSGDTPAVLNLSLPGEAPAPAAAAAEPAQASAPAAPAARALPDPAGLPLCGALLGPDPLLTLEGLQAGPFNRFAHAALTSVVSAPGQMYNPLFVSGPPGSGKSHMLHALAQKLGDPSAPVLLSSGARLARAAAVAAAAGRAAELAQFAAGSRALLIDDFHMMGITEQNQAALAGLLAAYLGAGKQVVLSSIYPPKLLAALEQALGFQLGAGHAVELKLPGEDKRKEIAGLVLDRFGLSGDESSRGLFADGAARDFAGVDAAARRLRTLRELRARAGQAAELGDLVAAVCAPDAALSDATAEELKPRLGAEPQGGATPAALLFPAGREVHADWAWNRLGAAFGDSGWAFPYRRAARAGYAVDPVFNAPFAVAAEGAGGACGAALVVGPPPGTDLAEHESDFRYAVEHLFRAASVPLGYVPCRRLKEPKAFLLAALDLQEGTV